MSSLLQTPPAGIPVVQMPTLTEPATDSNEERAPHSAAKRRKKPLAVVALALLLVGAAAVAYFINNPPVDESVEISDEEIAAIQAAARKKEQRDAAEQRDANMRAKILGTWELSEDGTYRLTLDPDGTGTLLYLPNFKYKVLLAWTSRLEIQMRWNLADAHVDMWSISGKPKRAFDIAIADRGKRKYYSIEKLLDDRLVLHDIKIKKTDSWARVKQK